MPLKSGAGSTGESVYLRLREMIVAAQLPPGERLVQRQLAALLGTSNIPVVEALRRLERDGLVESGAKWGGARVKEWRVADIRGLYLGRAALEGVACRLFCEAAGAAERERLAQLAREFDALSATGDHALAVQKDIELHRHIVSCCHSPSLAQLVENSCLISAAILASFPGGFLSSGPAGVHDGLLKALNGNSPDAAEMAGREHVLTAWRTFGTPQSETFHSQGARAAVAPDMPAAPAG